MDEKASPPSNNMTGGVIDQICAILHATFVYSKRRPCFAISSSHLLLLES